jgi:hypothetical protein
LATEFNRGKKRTDIFSKQLFWCFKDTKITKKTAFYGKQNRSMVEFAPLPNIISQVTPIIWVSGVLKQ